jgi:laminin alpha 3/5
MGNSPRPAVWVLEKSNDYGKTYKPWQYFAEHPSECQNLFNTDANKYIEHDDEVICTTAYSKAIPLEGGEVR